MTASTADLKITWEKLPEDFILDEEPVENIDQPLLAAALREILEIAGLIVTGILVAPNMGICATVDSKLVIKAPDWFYARNVQTLESKEIRRSYTPNLEGDIPAIVMEFLSATPCDEYSSKPTYPPGKWYFYEQVLRVPIYAIFEPATGLLEIYQLDSSGKYQVQQPDLNNHYWIAGVGLFLGVWQGTKAERTGYWLRWWDESGQMLLWGAEMVERERQEKANVQQRADRLAAQLRAAGIEPES
ncbi:Uma2 family endonuclease [Tychonema sp. LEGE 07199]|uniref:Uma2 family endonuclease n=1 Tax=unclassified Tychonema TaxID=2642144 RepID=UPI00188020FF|nr:Uma2 family endonuclease [Tychonema sp. LEGE 07199]MBE9134549.1 Uma2 family endonuclease [Tychonema sp. LEGE 07196]